MSDKGVAIQGQVAWYISAGYKFIDRDIVILVGFKAVFQAQ